VGPSHRLLLSNDWQASAQRKIALLATMKLGAVILPATPMLGPADLVDRVERGEARHVVLPAAHAIKFDDVPGTYTKITVGEPIDVSSRPRITGSRRSSSRVR